MFKFPVSTQKDLAEAAKREKRKQFEEERKKRIFDARFRLFGVDKHTLDRQLAERVKQRNEKLQLHNKEQENILKQQYLIYSKSLDEEKDRRAAEAEVNFFRCTYQNKEDRREFDINDPMIIKNARPVRIADDDPALGVSSAQIFEGEDLGFEDRRRRQRDQQRSWLDQQMRERRQSEAARKEADELFRKSTMSRDKLLTEKAVAEDGIKKQWVDSVLQYNFELAREKRIQKERAKKDEREDDLAEIYNMLTSDMLTENPDVAQSRTHPGKKVAYMYRGMSAEELRKFREEQYRQLVLYKRRTTDNELAARQWEQYCINMDHELLSKELTENRKQQEIVDENLVYNTQLAQQQREQRENDPVYQRNIISDDFYAQFNRDTR